LRCNLAQLRRDERRHYQIVKGGAALDALRQRVEPTAGGFAQPMPQAHSAMASSPSSNHGGERLLE